MSKKDFEPESIAVTLNQLIGKIEFRKSGYLAFATSLILTFLAVILSRLIH